MEKNMKKYMYMYSFALSCLRLCDPVDCSPPGSSVHGIFQTRVPEQVAISYSRESSQPRTECTSPESPELTVRFFTTVPSGKPTDVNQFAVCLKN